MKLQDLTIKEFLEKTASGSAVPGGGSTSALNAAVAAALTSMVAHLTIGRKSHEKVEGRMKEIIQELEEKRAFFTNYIDRDGEAYTQVMEAYKLPKDTEEQLALRNERIKEAMKQASLVPMEVAENALAMMDMIIETVQKGNRNAITDGMVGLMACRGAVMGALLSVRINISTIKDAQFVSMMTEKCDRVERDTIARERTMIDWVKSNL